MERSYGRRLRRKGQRVLGLVDGSTAVLIMAITVFGSLRILSRWFNLRLIGMGEMAQILTLWLVFLGLGRAALNENDIRADWLFNRLSTRAQAVGTKIILTINIATVAVILYSGLLVAQNSFGAETPTAGLPRTLKDGALFVGMSILLVVYLYKLGSDVRDGGNVS